VVLPNLREQIERARCRTSETLVREAVASWITTGRKG
jgi:hypothetical protein